MKIEIILGQLDTWSIIQSSQSSRKPAYLFEDCRILEQQLRGRQGEGKKDILPDLAIVSSSKIAV